MKRLFYKGYTPWNKGKTAKEDSRIAKLAYWKGKKNPKCSASKKGKPSWNKGVACSEETKRKLSEAKKGKPSPFKGKKHTEKAKRVIGEKGLGRVAWNKGLKGVMMPNKTSFKKGDFAGEKHLLWNGGTSNLPYAYIFTEELKKQIKERDNHICALCKEKKDLVVHHINYDKMNCNLSNLITLCRSHNSIVNFERNYWQKKIQSLSEMRKTG